jgi:cysteine desulfurase
MIYLDHNATTPIDEEVKKAMVDALDLFGNPSSSHSIGRAAKAAVDSARKHVADLIACSPSEVIFTSGGTESNNLAIIGTAYGYQKGHIITSVIEHPSVLNPVKWLQTKGFEATYIPVNSDGVIVPDDIRKAIRKNTILITVMHSNNETGVLQPISEIGRIAREKGIIFHSDTAQSIGKIDVKVDGLMADMLTVASHKFYGPKGIGALYIKDLGLSVKGGMQVPPLPMPLMFGAGHERGIRPGTENVMGIAGMGKACEIAERDMPLRFIHTMKLRDELFSMLAREIDIKLNGHNAPRLPNTLNVSISGIIGEEVVSELNDKAALSAGSACHSGIRRPSAVLKAMGLSDDDALSALRLSVGKDNSLDEINKAALEIIRCVKRLLEAKQSDSSCLL